MELSGHIPFTGNTSKPTTPQSAYGCQLPLHRGAVLSPRNGHRLSESSRVGCTLEKPPLCKGRCRAAAEGLWNCPVISRSRATSASLQPLSQPCGCQLPLHRGAVLSPRNGHRLSESSRVSRTLEKPPLCKGRCRVAAEGLWNCPVISRSRATSASLQPLSQPMAVSSPYTGEPFSAPEMATGYQKAAGLAAPLKSLPCVRGGAAQRRRGCKPCRISRLRAI